MEDSLNIEEIVKILKKKNEDKCNYEINSKSELSKLFDFFNQRGLNINDQLSDDVSKLFFEIAQNAFDYGKAKKCYIEISSDHITLYEDGQSFNPFESRNKENFGAGLTFAHLIKNKYADICEMFYLPEKATYGRNSLTLVFRKSISNSNLINNCYHFVSTNLYFQKIQDVSFDICEECPALTFDVSRAVIPPSLLLGLVDYLEKITNHFKPNIILKFRDNDSNKEMLQFYLNVRDTDPKYSHFYKNVSVQ